MTPADLRACNWDGAVAFRKSKIGYEIQLAAMKICLVRMKYPVLNKTFRRLVFPRMAWLGTYQKLVERRLALAMANHCRLGVDALIGCILSSNDIALVILGQM